MKCNLENIQIYPSENFKFAIDNLTRKTFEICLDNNDEAVFELLESRVKKLKSTVTISNQKALNIKFNEFDFAVFNATIAERIAGNDFTTVAIIRRHLGGKDKQATTLDQAIIDSLEKMAAIRIIAEMKEVEKIYDSPLKDSYSFRGYLLPTESLTMTINGQQATLIKFLSKGPIFAIADMKNQIITCPQELLEPPIKATPRTIAITHYLLRRILEIKGSTETAKTNKRVKSLRHTILFESLYKACDMETSSKITKQTARKTAESVLKYFVEKNLIKGYEFESGNAGKIRAINVDL